MPSPVGPTQFAKDLHLVGITSVTPTKVTFRKPGGEECFQSVHAKILVWILWSFWTLHLLVTPAPHKNLATAYM